MTDSNREPASDATREHKTRHDAFDGRRKRAFLDALGTRGCVREAARRTGVSPQTVYNHQRTDKLFARQCALALEKAATDLELEAWERAVKGEEVPIVYRGEVVGTRLKRSDGMLRFLLRAAKPKKYGAHAGFTRKRLVKAERDRIRREVHAEIATKGPTPDETDRAIFTKLAALKRHRDLRRKEEGWTPVEDGHQVPPGRVRAPAAPDPGAALRWPENRASEDSAPEDRAGLGQAETSDGSV